MFGHARWRPPRRAPTWDDAAVAAGAEPDCHDDDAVVAPWRRGARPHGDDGRSPIAASLTKLMNQEEKSQPRGEYPWRGLSPSPDRDDDDAEPDRDDDDAVAAGAEPDCHDDDAVVALMGEPDCDDDAVATGSAPDHGEGDWCDHDDGSSIASGDTAGSRTDAEIENGDVAAVSARRTERAQPVNMIVGDVPPYNEPAASNKRKDVGNVGLFICNLGERSHGTTAKSAAQRELHYSNVMVSPAPITILFEATHAVAAMLEQKPLDIIPGDTRGRGNLAQRGWYEHHVVITDEANGTILMAARKNNCAGVTCLHSDAWTDGVWKQKGKTRTATTRVMVCEFHWKQSIGHLGNSVRVMGVHGHYRTMNMLFAKRVTDEFWQTIHGLIVQHQVNFLVGDWNMSLPQVVPRLTALGLRVDLCSWYPWLHGPIMHAGIVWALTP